MNFQPLGKRILVERVEESTTTASGIIIPDNAKEKPSQAKVVAVSSEVEAIKVDDVIVFGKYSGQELALGTDKYIVLELDDVFGIIK
ncbi:MAG: co-chaperone GroES [Campylobacterota bacterium]|nr:co-chaperone GroES [Campylobacterota bacterium]